jgi:hypothetical protein
MAHEQGRRDGGWDRELPRRMKRQVVLRHLLPGHLAAEEWHEAVRVQAAFQRAAVAGTQHGQLGGVRRLFATGWAWLGGRGSAVAAARRLAEWPPRRRPDVG